MPKSAEIWSIAILLLIGASCLVYAFTHAVPGAVTAFEAVMLGAGVSCTIIGITTAVIVLIQKRRNKDAQKGGM